MAFLVNFFVVVNLINFDDKNPDKYLHFLIVGKTTVKVVPALLVS